MNWEKLKTFYQVGRAGSFTAAANQLHISQSALSRSIMQLEHQLKTKLFHRIPHGLELTRQGKVLYSIAQKMAFEAESVESLFAEDISKAEGPLRIATTIALASMWIPFYTQGFLDQYPDIRLAVIGNDDELDLNVRNADAAIRPLIPHQNELVQRYLVTFSPKLYVSPDYVEKHGCPKKVEDLADHRLLTYNDDHLHPYGNVNWILHAGKTAENTRKSFLRINLGPGLLQMAEQGVGIIAISDQYPPVKKSSLVQILPDWVGPSTKVYYSYPKQMKNIKRVEAFGD
ncbi:MAG: LysR family transcriptional regulator, partial [Alphaproteobacteria bacterium]|nr:LysR family transcriptional regulator [Alphaproteobacteria bacterium]